MCTWRGLFHNVAHGVTLDLEQDQPPAGVVVLKGTFTGNGLYRLFYSDSVHISVVTYGSNIVPITDNIPPESTELYVHEYRWDDKIIVGITINYGTRSSLFTIYFFKIEREYLKVSVTQKRKLVPNYISIPLDISIPLKSPIISFLENVSNSTLSNWYVVNIHDEVAKGSNNGPKIGNDRYFISPLLNVESYDGNGRPPMLVSQSTKIHIPHNREYIVICIGKNNAMQQKVKIPPIVNGIFTPFNIMEYSYDYSKSKLGSGLIDIQRLVIDISSQRVETPDIVLLANLKRGSWIYHQYAIAPIRHSGYMYSEVVNSDAKCFIYRIEPQEVVTHVEVFEHIRNVWQYVVVNVRKLGTNNKGEAGETKHIYKRIESENGRVYFDIKSVSFVLFYNMLYKIRVDENV
uniref:Uncharacterized protein n=2 Tax=Babesia bovis TaxID=5865 RepID=A7AQ47_BABBO|eukprot:XP_001612249.1 hypothetical protein [Babesia bovis T2Bo]